MRPTVQIAFNLGLAGAGDFFTIGDPIKGVWGSGSSPLAGDILQDVTDDVREVTFRRGRSDETSKVDAGSGTIALDNRLRLYDPLASGSVTPFAPSIVPRKEVTIDIGGQRQFSGIVEDWDLQYSPGGDSVTFVKLTDGLTLLNERTLASGAGATGLSGSVILQAASAVVWPLAKTDLDDGTASVGVHTLDRDTNVLQYMQKISTTEQGLVFIGKDGSLAFRDRVAPRRVFGTVFSDNGSGVPFRNIEITYGTEFLYTQTDITYLSGSATAVATFEASASAIADYGRRTYSLDTFLSGSAAASPIGDLLAARYGEPTLRITGIEVEMDGLTQQQKNKVLGLEIGDGVRVIFTPNGIGEAIDRELAVQSIEHSIRPGSHIVSVSLFDPVLLRESGSVTGSSTVGSIATGVKGAFGLVSGSSAASGSVTGVKGAFGSTIGTSGTAGTVTGTAAPVFVLDTSELDGTDTLR